MPSKSDYDHFLARKAAQLIRENFCERGVINLLVVKTGKRTRRKLGHIKTLKDREYGSTIEINPILFDPDVPEYVLDYVIMHELTHYFQGFGSNHEKKGTHPHRGGLVDKELERLGWKEIMEKSEKWLKESWPTVLQKNGMMRATRPRIKKISLFPFHGWFR
ncbi:MAG: hypothetical protein AABW59_00770 [archaeon]